MDLCRTSHRRAMFEKRCLIACVYLLVGWSGGSYAWCGHSRASCWSWFGSWFGVGVVIGLELDSALVGDWLWSWFGSLQCHIGNPSGRPTSAHDLSDRTLVPGAHGSLGVAPLHNTELTNECFQIGIPRARRGGG